MMCCVHSLEDALGGLLGGRVVLRALRPGPGRRNQLAEACVGGQRYVLKLGAALAREAWALGALPPGLGPALVQGPKRGAAGGPLVMEHLAGEPLTRSRARPVLGALAGRIAALHAIRPRRGPPLACPSLPPALLALAEELARALRERGVISPEVWPVLESGLTLARAHLGRLDPQRWRRPVRALCHGDLAWHNVLMRGRRLWLIDFELAGLGDPAVDLALLLSRNPLTRSDERRFLAAYQERSKDRDCYQRYVGVFPLVSLVSALNGLLAVEENAVGWPSAALKLRARRGARELDRALRRLGRTAVEP